MTSMVVGGLFNAVAFAGAGFLFNKLNHSGYSEEIKRHNLATEKLAKAKEAWHESETRRKNKIEEKRREQDNANADINSTNKALGQLNAALERDILTLEGLGTPEPDLSSFYKPSNEMKEYEVVAVGVLGTLGGYLGYKAYNRLRK